MSLFRSASTVSLLTLASRITGLVRELLIAATFGASVWTDAFNVAFRLPNMFRRLFAEGAFSQAFVPVLAASREKDSPEQTRELIDSVATLLLWSLLLLCAIGIAGAPLLVWLLASGLKQNPQGMDAAVTLARWMFPYIGCMSLVALSAGILNTWRRYAVPAATPVLLNLCMIGAAWLLAPQFAAHGLQPIHALAAGVLLGGMLQLGIQIPALRAIGMLPRFDWRWRRIRQAALNAEIRKITRLMGAALLGVSVAQISLIINTQIASWLQPGSVSWLSYADRLMEFPIAILGVALGVVLMPQLAAAQAAGARDQYSGMLDWGLRLVVLLGVPSAIGLMLFTQPIVATLYHYGAFADSDVTQTSLALRGYGAGVLGLVAVKVLAPGFYAQQNIRTPVRIAIVVLICTQLMNVALVPWLAHAGLALSIGLGAIFNALLLLRGLRNSGSYIPAPGWARFFRQIALGSLLLGIYLQTIASAVDWTALRAHSLLRVGLLALSLAGAAMLYFGALQIQGMKLKQLLRR